MDETEITNNEYRQFVLVMLTDSSQLGEEYIMKELYPDTTVWVRNFSHHMGDPMMEYYFSHPAFDDYPAVGIDWFAARKFSEWRTNYLNAYRADISEQTSACTNSQANDLLKTFSEFSVLCAVREGPFGVTQLNAHIEKSLGFNSNAWYVGRPVMVTRNDYALELMNGDVGICLPGPNSVLRVAFPGLSGGVRWIVPSRLDSVETVFAMTVHKSQGSEFKHVLLVVPAQDSPVLTRELVYTGLTRAREDLTIWAPRKEVLLQACSRRVLRSGGLGAG